LTPTLPPSEKPRIREQRSPRSFAIDALGARAYHADSAQVDVYSGGTRMVWPPHQSAAEHSEGRHALRHAPAAAALEPAHDRQQQGRRRRPERTAAPRALVTAPGSSAQWRLSPKAMRQLGQTALGDVAEQLSGRHGERDTRCAGAAGELTGVTRPWQFGDTEPWIVTRTLTNAVLRQAPAACFLVVEGKRVV